VSTTLTTTPRTLMPFRQHVPTAAEPIRPLTTRRRAHPTRRTAAGDTTVLWTSDGLLSNLAVEWTAASSTRKARATARSWGAASPELQGYSHAGQVLDDIDAAATEDKDAKLAALIRLTHAGDALAARTVLQAMLPKLGHIARYADISRDRQDDRGQVAVGAFLTTLHRYPLERRPTGIAGNLALDTLHAVTDDRRRPATVTEIVVDDVQAVANAVGCSPAVEAPQPNAAAELDKVLAWAVTTGAITTTEHDLLAAVFAPEPGQRGGHIAVAAARGMTPAAVRQRCSRATRSIRRAVLDAAGTAG
jgi:hypothetical protein